MIILSAIGRFFARIGRWIRDTAWVQPLLIVGGIFAIIFSIPYITKWVQSWYDSQNAAESFFGEYKVSLENCKDGNSDADKLFRYMNGTDNQEEGKAKYGDKFFIMFTKSDCEGCTDAYEGLKYLRDNWNKNEFSTGDQFRMYTLFVDTLDDDNEKNLFQTYFYNTYDVYFEELAGSMTASPYYTNKGGSSSSYATNIESLADPEAMSVPTLFFVDFSKNETAPQHNTLRVSEILFNVDAKDTQGSNSLGRARTLFDCWNHTDIFSADYQQDN